MMAIIPPTPADPKGKGKQQEADTPIPIHSHPIIDGTVGDTVGDTGPKTPCSDTSTGAISKSNKDHLDELWPKIEQDIANAAEFTGLPADRIARLLGKRLGLNVRGSTLWNSYQSYFAGNVTPELQRIGAQAEYDNATSAEKPAIVSRAQAAFKAYHEKDEEWMDILQTWDTIQTVKKGCKGQSYTTREARFDAMNHKLHSFVSFSQTHRLTHVNNRLSLGAKPGSSKPLQLRYCLVRLS